MAKRTKHDESPALDSSDDEPRLITYRGGHPLIRRCGYAFEPHKPKRVPAGVAAVLVAIRDFEDSSPPAPDSGDSELPPAA